MFNPSENVWDKREALDERGSIASDAAPGGDDGQRSPRQLRNRDLAVNFLRALREGLTLAKKDAGLTKKIMRKYARLTTRRSCKPRSIL